MAHLTDMEELLARIPRREIAEYMREAFACYGAGAYRGCIVLSFIALSDDLFAKLKELAAVSSAARAIHTAADSLRQHQDVFERFLIDKLAAEGLMSNLDASTARILAELRNKSAHPSGHGPSAEEARFVFSEAISRFLASPVLRTTHVIEGIIARLGNANLFPSHVHADVKAVVASETEALDPSAAAFLIAALAREHEGAATDAIRQTNIAMLFVGLSALDNEAFNSQLSKLIRDKADNQRFASVSIQILSSRPKLLLALDAVTKARIAAFVRSEMENVSHALPLNSLAHPAYLISALMREVREGTALEPFRPECQVCYEKWPTVNMVVSALAGNPGLASVYLTALKARAGSATYDTANAIAEGLPSIDEALSALATDRDAFEIILHVLRAAEWGAWKSRDLRAVRFQSMPRMTEMARRYASALPIEAEACVTTVLGAGRELAAVVAEAFAPASS